MAIIAYTDHTASAFISKRTLMSYDVMQDQWTHLFSWEVVDDFTFNSGLGKLIHVNGELAHIQPDGSVMALMNGSWKFVAKYDFNQTIITVIPYYV